MTRFDWFYWVTLGVVFAICGSMYVYAAQRSAAFRARCVQAGGEAVAAYVCVKPGSRITVNMEGWR